jgi:hypothetical protein
MITVMVENLCSCHGKFFSNSAFKSFAPRVGHGFYTPRYITESLGQKIFQGLVMVFIRPAVFAWSR